MYVCRKLYRSALIVSHDIIIRPSCDKISLVALQLYNDKIVAFRTITIVKFKICADISSQTSIETLIYIYIMIQ